MIDSALVTTVTEIPNYRIARNFGIVRGIVVRSRSIVGNIGATLQTLLGGSAVVVARRPVRGTAPPSCTPHRFPPA